jgi:D-sedoheptulose 7-phosphate isomerase
MKTNAAEYLHASVGVLERMLADAGLLARIERAGAICSSAIAAGRKVMFAGNGGSAADAQHLAGELVSRFNYDRPGMAGIALTVDTSVLTAISNDYGYERSFSRQVEALGVAGDVLVGISTSGNSPNVLRALVAARGLGITTIGFTGHDGGRMAPLCDLEIRIPDRLTPLIQQGHLAAGHIVCALTEEAMHPRSA